MTSKADLLKRCEEKCELCSAQTELAMYEVPESSGQADSEIMICSNCQSQIENPDQIELKHWHCLNESMWSTVPAVQIMAWRQLKRLSTEVWAQDLLDMLYLDEDMQAWAEAGATNEDETPTKDSNGATLQAGDTVTIIKDLNVKGTSFVAKRGTSVRGISLTNNPEHIEGRVNGTRIVILTEFVKKS
ncbi:MAG: PhnA domain-containing protein [Pseudomonadales bacterium]